jgi:hypothetical protein
VHLLGQANITKRKACQHKTHHDQMIRCHAVPPQLMKQRQRLLGLAGLREAAYEGVPRFVFSSNTLRVRIASLRVAADERALGEGLAREAALGSGGVELQA